MSIWTELQRRNVVRVGIAYIIVSWLIAQVADLVLDNTGAPEWVMQVLLLLLLLGLPLVLFFSWAYEVTPEGIKRESEIDRSASITGVTGRKLDRSITVLLVVALGYFIWESRLSDRSSPVESPAVTDSSTPGDTGPVPAKVVNRQSIAVLPFENRSNREEDEFFTDGIHDDLLTTIANIGSMKVISRTSVMEYKGTTKKIPEIARELGVANILEGGIQRAGNKVRINVQLINAETDEHLWAEIFDRELNVENLFAIQSEISEAIATALQATLSPEEKQRIQAVPTENLQAYDAYLHGRHLLGTRDSAGLQQAMRSFREAVDLDPQFALAWVGIADAAGLMQSYSNLSAEEALSLQGEALERALSIDDSLGEAYANLGTLHADAQRFQDAEVAYQKAIELSPNYATAYHWYSNFLANYPLRSREALQLAQKAQELDPRSPIIGVNLAARYSNQGMFALGERQYAEVLELAPDFAPAHRSLSEHFLWDMGRADKALPEALGAIELDPGNLQYVAMAIYSEVFLGNIERAQQRVLRMEEIDANHPITHFIHAVIEMYRDDPDAARAASERFAQASYNVPDLLRLAGIVELMLGDEERARELLIEGNPGWLDKAKWPGLIPTANADGCLVAWVLLQTGEEVLGRDMLRESSRFMIEELPKAVEHADQFQPETCYLAVGDTENALASIEMQLAHNHIFSWDLFHRIDLYDAIRDEPRYLAAMDQRASRIAKQRVAVEAGLNQ